MVSHGLIKGTTYLLAGQCALVIAGVVINISLGRILGTSGYGIYSVITTFVTLCSLILISGIPRATAYYTSKSDINSLNILKSSLLLAFTLSLVITILVIVLSPFISALFNEPELTNLLQLVAFTLPALTLVSVVQGYYSGKWDYKNQALLTIYLYVSRIVFIILFVTLNASVLSAVVGYTISPIIPLLIAFLTIGFGFVKVTRYSMKDIISFAFPSIVFLFSTYFFINMGLFYVKIAFLNDASAGLYSAASTISQLPYLAMVAITTAIFPAISGSGEEKTRVSSYIFESMRYSLLFMVPLVIFVITSSGSLLSLVYTSEYIAAASSLSILIVGTCIFSLFLMLSTVISAIGRPAISMFIGIFIIFLNIPLQILLAPSLGLAGVALSLGVSSSIGLVIAGAFVIRSTGKFFSLLSLIRITAGGVVLFVIMSIAISHGLNFILGYLLGGAVYFAILYSIGEIHERDIFRLKELLLWF